MTHFGPIEHWVSRVFQSVDPEAQVLHVIEVVIDRPGE